MFKTEDIQYAKVVEQTKGNYKIATNDYLNVFVYTNKGERIVDPNQEFNREGTGAAVKGESVELNPQFLVKENGMAKLPMVGDVYLKDFTLYQADSVLENYYSKFYEDVYVITRLVNKRITVLGPTGGKIIRLDNENMNLIEILALYGGISGEGKANNIRLIRGDLKNPQVEVIDLSTIEGMRRATLKVESNDIIYIEQRKKLLSESIRNVSAVIAVVTNLITVTFLILKFSNE